MMQVLLIGVGAGAASALLCAAAVATTPVAAVLAWLMPLPILIAALGWSHWAALIAAAVASASVAFLIHPTFFLAFLIAVGLPAWWLGYLALLARPVEGVPDGLEWYPVGRLVVWAAILSAVVGIIAIGIIDSEPSIRAYLRDHLEEGIRAAERAAPDAPMLPPGVDAGLLASMMVGVVPLVGAMFLVATNALNLWLASRIVRISGRLSRPQPDVSAMRFPVYAPALIGLAFAACFLPGLFKSFGMVVTASMLVAYAILGLAVLHAITRGMSGRPFALGGIYAALIIFSGWPLPLFSLLGLVDTAIDLRGRVAARKNSGRNNSTPS